MTDAELSREEPRFVRFGAVPRTNRSANFRAGEYLAGVSAYSGRLDEERGFVIDTSELTMEGGAGALITLAACDWPAFFVEGSEVGRGPDGEPLLKVEHSWSVPETTSITSIQTWSQPALKLWSDGPRDGSGASVQQWRLKDGSPYVPEFITSGVQDSPSCPTGGCAPTSCGSWARRSARRTSCAGSVWGRVQTASR